MHAHDSSVLSIAPSHGFSRVAQGFTYQRGLEGYVGARMHVRTPVRQRDIACEDIVRTSEGSRVRTYVRKSLFWHMLYKGTAHNVL